MSKADDNPIQQKLRQIPSVEKILESPELKSDIDEFSHPFVAGAVKQAVETIREEVKKGRESVSVQEIVSKVKDIVAEQTSSAMKPVINAAGVVLHTNLGRAPLDEDTLSFIKNISSTYNNLEFDLKDGKRSKRGIFVEKLLCALTSTEAAMAVNNNAGAVLLILTALAKNKEVIVSRGELVQIGGGFRIPEILSLSGAILKEVGTTNQTRLSDYENAITTETALLLKVHQSNFKMIGFEKRPFVNELVKLGKRHSLCVVEDLGSGVLLRTEDYEMAHEPTALEALSAGVDLVCFSGDIEILKTHPLHRALRLDKMFLAGLERVLLCYLKGEATRKIPAWQMISTPLDSLQTRAEKIRDELQESGIEMEIQESQSTVGGGSLPGETLPTIVISVKSADLSPDQQAKLFRKHTPPIIGRIEEEKFVLDLRTVFPHQDEILISAVKSVFSKKS
jgi:L-seryl-tRNA(Ser) seleniumtransferase